MQQISPISLVTHANNSNHNRLLTAPNLPPMGNLIPHDIEQRMMDYIKYFQATREPRLNGE